MKNAFITGAAQGMGRLMAQKLATDGWNVFAGVLPSENLTELENGPKVTIIEQDVSSDDSVIQSAAQVKAALNGAGLHLLINNAGIANMAQGVIEGVDIAEAQTLFNINTFGQLRCTQAFLPMIREAGRGARIINFSSGAIVANPPGAGIYNMSKYAVHGMTMVLRHELATFGVEVCSILPGGVKTAMTANAHETTKAIWDKVPQNVRDTYYPALGDTTTKVLPDMLEKTGNDPDMLTDAVLKIAKQSGALKPSYLVGQEVKPMIPMRRLLSERGLERMMRSQFKIPSKLS